MVQVNKWLVITTCHEIRDGLKKREEPKNFLHPYQMQSMHQRVREHKLFLSHHLHWCEWSNLEESNLPTKVINMRSSLVANCGCWLLSKEAISEADKVESHELCDFAKISNKLRSIAAFRTAGKGPRPLLLLWNWNSFFNY